MNHSKTLYLGPWALYQFRVGRQNLLTEKSLEAQLTESSWWLSYVVVAEDVNTVWSCSGESEWTFFPNDGEPIVPKLDMLSWR